MENKYKVHLAIGEYEFIEKETEGGTDEEFTKSINNLRKLLDTPDDIPLEEWEKMSPEQQSHHQEIKKARSVIRYHKNKLEKVESNEDKFKKDLK